MAAPAEDYTSVSSLLDVNEALFSSPVQNVFQASNHGGMFYLLDLDYKSRYLL